ncbi:MAG: hypothetical protein HYZ81_13440 [Nitrospinae bacterium]|nr:hypothetical protein [Nitrospinota bacterium]
MQRGHAGKTEDILYAGTVGQGVHRSRDGGAHWEGINFGLPPHCDVRALAAHRELPHLLFAGTDHGCFSSQDGGLSWKRMRAFAEDVEVWSLYICPWLPALMFAGTRPAHLYCSRDSGRTWTQLAVDLPATTRVTAIAVDPEDADTVYVGIQVGGLLRSVDGGHRWETINEGLTDLDIHDLCVSASSPPTLHVATASDIFRSRDWGEHWEAVRLKERLPMTYIRALHVAPHNHEVLYAAAGMAPFGEDGALYRSTDLGETWSRFDSGSIPRSTVWTIAVNPIQPRRIFAGTLQGHVLRTFDEGRVWEEHTTPFEELRALLCVPV